MSQTHEDSWSQGSKEWRANIFADGTKQTLHGGDSTLGQRRPNKNEHKKNSTGVIALRATSVQAAITDRYYGHWHTCCHFLLWASPAVSSWPNLLLGRWRWQIRAVPNRMFCSAVQLTHHTDCFFADAHTSQIVPPERKGSMQLCVCHLCAAIWCCNMSICSHCVHCWQCELKGQNANFMVVS